MQDMYGALDGVGRSCLDALQDALGIDRSGVLTDVLDSPSTNWEDQMHMQVRIWC